MSTPPTDRARIEEAPVSQLAESVRARVQSCYEKFLRGEAKLDQKFEECRWGVVDNLVVVIHSTVTGAAYVIDRQSAAFYRTHTPQSTRLVSSAPREVIAQDRDWLSLSLKRIPGGQEVLERYRPGEKVVEAPRPVPAPAARPQVDEATRGMFAGLKPQVSEKRIVWIERTEALELGLHQLHVMLKAVGLDMPKVESGEAKLEITPEGYLRIFWTDLVEKGAE